MQQYVICYFGGNHTNDPQDAKEQQARYMEWLQSLGSAVVSPMNPFKNSRTILPDGSVKEGSATAMSGYTIVQAESIEAAVTMTRSCPFLEIEGTLEVSELVQM